MIHVADALAVRAKKGDPDAVLGVWRDSHRIRGLAAKRVPLDRRDDWNNESFFVLLRAISNYKRNLGRFDSHLTRYLIAYRMRFLKDSLVRRPARSKVDLTFCELEEERADLSEVPTAQDIILMPRLLSVLASLDERKMKMLSKHFGLFGYSEHTFGEASDGVSRQRVTQIVQESVVELSGQVKKLQKNRLRKTS